MARPYHRRHGDRCPDIRHGFIDAIGGLDLPGEWVDYLFFGLMALSGPYGFYRTYQMKKVRDIEKRLPEFLRDVAEAGRFGMTLSQAIKAASKGRYGSLTPEIRRMASQIDWGVPASDAMRLFADRVDTPLVRRMTSIIIKANDAGGNVADVLTMVAHDAREAMLNQNERAISMATYTVVIYVAFAVFIATIFILNTTFLPKMMEVAPRWRMPPKRQGPEAPWSPSRRTSSPSADAPGAVGGHPCLRRRHIGRGAARRADTERATTQLHHAGDRVHRNEVDLMQAARTFDEIEPLFEDDTEENEKLTLTQRYLAFLLRIKNRPLRVRLPYGSKVDGKPITEIPRITSPTVEEVEISAIEENYAYSRITYDSVAGEYLYEVIEPKLTEDELNLLDVLKKALIVSLNLSSDPSPEHRKEVLNKAADKLMNKLGLTLQPISRERILYYLRRDFIGYGAINVMMIDPNIEDCSCDGVGIPLYIYHRKYGSIQTNVVYEDERELDEYVVWLAQKCGKHISVADPLLDATIPDGSRLNATLGKHVTKRGSSFTIRRFKDNPFTPVDLIRFKTLNTEMMAYLWISVEFGSSMMVCGGTASGKTTTLNAILLFIPPQMKIVSIEDTRELNLPHENWIPGLTREGFSGGGSNSGTINMFDLLTAALAEAVHLMVGEVKAKRHMWLPGHGHRPHLTDVHAETQPMVQAGERPHQSAPGRCLAGLVRWGQVSGHQDDPSGQGAHRAGDGPRDRELITNSVH